MLKASEIIAQKENAEFLITGENLAQVSSQTLTNLESITKPIKLTILRPLLTYDKMEIMNIGKEIGTYKTSQGPEICCLLGPKHPLTKSNPNKVLEELNKLDYGKIIKIALSKSEIIIH